MPRGVVLRYGALYGPGTWHDLDGAVAEALRRGEHVATPAWASFLHVDDAASAAVAALDWPAGPVNVVDDEPATAMDWMPVLAEAVGAPSPPAEPAAEATGRPISNAAARALGWEPAFPTWRSGFARQAA
jgi:nucleoside-diphosphate-sugar epimerase